MPLLPYMYYVCLDTTYLASATLSTMYPTPHSFQTSNHPRLCQISPDL